MTTNIETVQGGAGQRMTRRVLMIAYHYPPVRISSGIQRTLKFSQYLLQHNWTSMVLTVHPRAYGPHYGTDQLNEIPNEVSVKRAFALDTARHLSVCGRYFRWMALPDRWVSWLAHGVISGLSMIRRSRPEVIWSTYPIATAHLIGLMLHRITGIPWVADFRDNMTDVDNPPNVLQRKAYRWIERQTVTHCARAIFTTPGAVRMYAERYPDIPQSRWGVIGNGYDEENFINAENALTKEKNRNDPGHAPLKFVHSGTLYPWERDPRQFYQALSALLKTEKIREGQLKIILRATGHDDYHDRLIRELGINRIVFLEAGMPYEGALKEMMTADGLLIFQASMCNHQIPAKLYEYMRARRPIFGLTDPKGDTAQVLRDVGVSSMAPLDDKQAIMRKFLGFIESVKEDQGQIASNKELHKHSRESKTEELAKLFDTIAIE